MYTPTFYKLKCFDKLRSLCLWDGSTNGIMITNTHRRKTCIHALKYPVNFPDLNQILQYFSEYTNYIIEYVKELTKL